MCDNGVVPAKCRCDIQGEEVLVATKREHDTWREGGPVVPKRERETTGEGGFSLIEALVAAGLLAVALVTLCELFVAAMRTSLDSRSTTFATVLAQQKVEELRALTWGFDPMGIPITDTTTNTAVDPAQPFGGTGLSSSPASALQRNTPGFTDYVDRFGHTLGGGASPPPNTAYTRRWSIEPVISSPGNTVVIQVLVTPRFERGAAEDGAVRRLAGEARLVAVRTRKSQ
jgi:type II secretory pathway pseudopilin PulG